MGRRWMTWIAVTMTIVGTAATGRGEDRGVQITPDGKRVLVNKDVGAERWAMTLNENGTATGNVFRGDGGPPAFVFCEPVDGTTTFDCFGANACRGDGTTTSAIQIVPDATRLLVQKNVGAERWAISKNFDDGTATGNVFRSDGGDPAFVFCQPAGDPETFRCSGADKCRETPCTEPFTAIGTVRLPASFFAAPDPCEVPWVPLGRVTLPEGFFAPTATRTVTFEVGATEPIQAFDVRVTYPRSAGSFVGSAGDVSCTSDGDGIFTKNEIEDTATLVLLQTSPLGLRLPVTIRCTFAAVGALAPTDFRAIVPEVTQNNEIGDPSVATVRVVVE